VTPTELSRELERGKFHPVYYFYGEADFRIKEAERAVIRQFLPKSQLTINHDSLTATKSNFAEILTALAIFPMMGEKQTFTISDIQIFGAKDIEKLLSLMSPPDPNRLVILTSPSDKIPDKRSKTLPLLIEKTAAVEFKRLTGDMVEKRIISSLKEYKIIIEPPAISALIMLTGGDLGGLTGELDKLISYAGNGGVIKKDDILNICSDYQAFKIYELTNAVAEGNFDRAIEIIGTLLSQGEKPTGLLFMLGEHFIDLYLVKNNKPLPSRKKGTEWKFRNQDKRFNNASLEKIITLVAAADFDLRNNIKPENLVIEKLALNICKLCGKKGL
jgi:DNA polymerase-3 subunit delta